MARKTMTTEEINQAIELGYQQCVIEAQSDGTLCWDIEDTREREPVHQVSKGEKFWCWNFVDLGDGNYTHDYGNMSGTAKIETDVKFTLVYVTDDGGDPVLFDSEVDKSPNIT